MTTSTPAALKPPHTASVAAQLPRTPWSTSIDGLRITLQPLSVPSDIPLIHAWLTHPRSLFWQMQEASLQDVETMYRTMADSDEEHAWLGCVDGEATFLVETYNPQRHPLSEHLAVHSDDLGMHVLIAPPQGAGRSGLTSTVMRAIMTFCFSFGAGRIIVEPDVRNTKILAKNASVGFERILDVDLADKRAALSVCTASNFHHHVPQSALSMSTQWDVARRVITAKALGEFAHELLIAPEETGPGEYSVATPPGQWTFTAQRFELDHWVVAPASIEHRTSDGTPQAVDPCDLVADLRQALGLNSARLGTYLEELSATVAHRVRTNAPGRERSTDLISAPAHEIESAMSEGHPCFVATNGRIGFSNRDLDQFTPEAAADVHPLWLAVRQHSSHLSAIHAHADAADEARLYRKLLGESWHAEVQRRMQVRGIAESHRPMPVHPWQWREKISTTFAADIAAGDIVLLGEDPDAYRPAQSVRTWNNVSDPARPQVKMALSIRNMGFVRGLSPAYMRATPAINDYVARVVADDPTFADLNFEVLREFAAIGYVGDTFHRHATSGHHTKMLAALWRESPVTRAAAGTQLMTMAALLHRDPDGDPLVAELIRASGLTPRGWVERYLNAYVQPILHLLCTHRLAFIPHGENIILKMVDHAVTGVFLKDIGEEVGLMDDGHARPLPEEAGRIRVETSSEMIALGLFTDVFDGFLRFLGPILDEAGLLPHTEFWDAVRACVQDYAENRPDAAATLPLFAPTFARSCLNRLQLRNPEEMVQLDDAVGSLLIEDELPNPLLG